MNDTKIFDLTPEQLDKLAADAEPIIDGIKTVLANLVDQLFADAAPMCAARARLEADRHGWFGRWQWNRRAAYWDRLAAEARDRITLRGLTADEIRGITARGNKLIDQCQQPQDRTPREQALDALRAEYTETVRDARFIYGDEASRG